ncbi:hypothetical protein BSQ40_14975 [Serratia fonticola]|nr:hypothetical protein BSQ40_14975 [Serratia fonticola]
MDAKYEKALQKMQEIQDVVRVELPSAAIGRAAYALIKSGVAFTPELVLQWLHEEAAAESGHPHTTQIRLAIEFLTDAGYHLPAD